MCACGRVRACVCMQVHVRLCACICVCLWWGRRSFLAWFILFGFLDGDVTREGGKEGTREHLVMGARAMGLMEARVHGREASGSTTQGL